MQLKPPFTPSLLPETLTYYNALRAGAYTVKMETLQAIDRFVRDCYNAGIWSKLIEVYPFCGDSLGAAMFKLKNASTQPSLAVNLVESDYNERGGNGGIWGNGATKY